MSGTVLTFPGASRPARPAPQPRATRPSGYGGTVYLVDGEGSDFVVWDESPSGGSAGHHGWFATHAEAVKEARTVAERLGADGFTDLSQGATA